MAQILANWQSYLWSIVILSGAAGVGLLIHKALFALATKITRRTRAQIDQVIVEQVSAPVRIALVLMAMSAVTPALPWPGPIDAPLRHAIVIALMLAGGWGAYRLVSVLSGFVAARYRDVSDHQMARRVRTQFQVIQRIAELVVVVVTVGAILLTFPGAWQFGAGLFASAGVAGLILGLAARPVLENLLAGIQIAITQPLRIDDEVLVQGEFGTVEELGSSYVVVRVWDGRRLIVPLSQFIQQPFQNWTKSSIEMLGTVFLYVDYTVPVDDVRAEVKRIVENTDLWDRKMWNLQVTNMTEKSVELRVLVSAADPSHSWDLRCHVREKLVEYLRDRHPDALPTVRAELQSEPLSAPKEVERHELAHNGGPRRHGSRS